MEGSVILIVCCLIGSHCVIAALGLFCGIYFGKVGSQDISQAPTSFLKNQGKKQQDSNKIEIDDKKVVLNINTDGLQKKFEKITEEKTVDNNISSSVNKLKNMKGK